MTLDVKKYAFIDALRGYGVLGVVLVHSSQFVAPDSHALKVMMSNGARGVQLFYIASAMTLCMSLHSRISREAHWLRNFFVRRLFRIAPMFYIAIIGYLLLYGFAPRYWAPNGMDWRSVALTVFFINGFNPETINSVVPGGWSIAVEFNFYLMLPLLFLHLKTRTSLVAFFAFSVALYAVSTIALLHFLSSRYPLDQQYLVAEFCRINIISQLPIFSLGMIAYYELRRSPSSNRSVGVGCLVFLSSLIVLALISAHIVGTSFYHEWSNVYFGFGLTLFALLLSCYPVALTVNAAIVQVGKLSFSMYLTHFAVLEGLSHLRWQRLFAPGDLASVFNFIIVVLLTVCVSYVSYMIVERPGIRLGNSVIDSLERHHSMNG
jgi:peptidoglycan/LPS O-acetylase OafA/YrhL